LSGQTEELFSVPGVPSVVADPSQFDIHPFPSCYYSKSLPGTIIKIIIDVAFLAAPNLMKLKVIRSSYLTQAIPWIMFTVILINKTANTQNSYPEYKYLFSLSSSPAGPNYLLSDMPANLGIDAFFQNSALGGYQEYCLIGVRDL
jgi:hypothetical protein